MQPQGHVQVLLNYIHGKLNPQASIDFPRYCIPAGYVQQADREQDIVWVEEGMPNEILEYLKKLGHHIVVKSGYERSLFGRGQMIFKKDGVLCGGSDSRADGCAIGY